MSTRQLVDDLKLLSVQILDHPDRPETQATWRRVKKHLALENQAEILLVWNKHLTGNNRPDEITDAVDATIDELLET